jgi:hypothetical protein
MRRAGLLGLLLLAPVGCGGGEQPDSYVGTASATAVYVTWTRSDRSLTGELTRALIPARAAGVRTDRVGFTGTVAGSSVSLRLAHGLGARKRLSGTLAGNTLTLDYPGGDASVSTIRLRRADRQAFGRELASLRQTAARAVATPAAGDHAGAAAGVREALAALADPHAKLRAAWRAVQSSYASVRSDEAYNYTDTICDDTVGLDEQVAAMKRVVASLSGGRASTAGEIAALRRRFAALEDIPAAQRPTGAPTRRDVDAAIRAARRRSAAIRPRARRLLARAGVLKTKADAACKRANS